MFFDEKDTFFTENERFARLIRFYARRLKDDCAEADLWSFLWELLATAKKPLPDRYIAVCIRNEWIKLSKAEAYLPVPICDDSMLCFVDNVTDLRVAVNATKLKALEKIRLNYFELDN